MKNVDDIEGFNRSLGGPLANTPINIGCAGKSESWQVLAPTRGMPHGVLNINHIIHGQYRENYTSLAKERDFGCGKIPEPFGPEGIVYGDKVINAVNKKRTAYPDDGNAIHYVANGEIGIAFSNWVKRKGESAMSETPNCRTSRLSFTTGIWLRL